MTLELIISIISLVATFIVGVLTLVVNIRIGKMENTEALHKYEKNITNFELQFKDEQWLYDLTQSGEINNYSDKAKAKIFRWWAAYSKEHMPVLLIPHIDMSKVKTTRNSEILWMGSSGKEVSSKKTHPCHVDMSGLQKLTKEQQELLNIDEESLPPDVADLF